MNEPTPDNRKPILLSKNTCALIFMFHRPDEFLDVCMGAYDNWDSHKLYQGAAKEFIDQLQEHWSISFIEALKKEIDDILTAWKGKNESPGKKTYKKFI